jgi:hypothetical protein
LIDFYDEEFSQIPKNSPNNLTYHTKASRMPITRRTALQRIFIVAGGVIFLPACKHEGDNRQETLEAIADTLIPSGQTPGAKAVGAHLFALRMISDCYPQNQQQQYMRGLKAFDAQARQQYGKSFAACDQQQQATLVSAINAGQESQKTDDLSFFFRENKNLVIRGYLGSQYFLTKIEVYELVPGRWHGCTPVIKKT